MINYTREIIGYITVFEKVTRSKVKDCFLEDNQMYFVVQPFMLKKALGNRCENVKRLVNMFNKPIRIIEFNPNPVRFVKNLLYPIKPKDIFKEENTIKIVPNDIKEKGKIFGREKSNFKKVKEIFSKYFNEDLEII